MRPQVSGGEREGGHRGLVVVTDPSGLQRQMGSHGRPSSPWWRCVSLGRWPDCSGALQEEATPGMLCSPRET